MKKWINNKNIIYLAISLVVLVIVIVVCYNSQVLKPENIGKEVNTQKKEYSQQEKYPEFKGEKLNITEFISKDLVVDDRGTHYFPNKTVEDIVNAFVKSSETLKLESNTTTLEQNLRFNSLTGDNLDTKLRRTLTANNSELTESLEMSVYTDGNAGVYASSVILNIKADTWDKSNNIFNTVLTELNIESELKEALLKSDRYFGNIQYTDSNQGFTVELRRDNNFSCNTSLVITHNTDELESETIYLSESLESFDELTEDFNLINSSKHEYSYEYGGNTFGNDVIDIVMKLLNKEYIGSLADSTFKGVKGNGGVRYSEEFNFVNSCISSDGEIEVVVTANYLNGAVNVELDINNLKEAFTEDEKEYCRNALIDFLNVTYEGCNISDVSEITGEYSKNTTTVTDVNNNQYTVTYGEIDDGFMLNYVIEGYNENLRSEGFNTYK